MKPGGYFICASDYKCRFIEVPCEDFTEYGREKKEEPVTMRTPEPI
jgi:hypothetical protein